MTNAGTLPIENEFDDNNDFWSHPIYDNYEANRNGIIRNIKRKKPIGSLTLHTAAEPAVRSPVKILVS